MRIIPGYASVGLCLIIFLLVPGFSQAQVQIGAEQREMYFPRLIHKKIGVVANTASMVGDTSIVDLLVRQGFSVVKIFSPEHGFRLSAEAGEITGNSFDSATGIPVISLYGKNKKPAAQDLQSVDLMLFDIQDVGVRFYTYISTLAYVMEACAEQGVPLIVLDRPNPNGFYIDGPVLEKQYASFVGLHPVPVVYGMTIGEYAKMVNGERWLKNQVKCDLEVVPLINYAHRTRYTLPAKPSPNLSAPNAVYLYPSLCFFEGTNISVGRGTGFPFQAYGHPDLSYGTFSFTPERSPGASLGPLLEGRVCKGEDLREYYSEHPGDSGRLILQWLIRAYKGWPDKTTFFTGYFNNLAGNSKLQDQVIRGKAEKEIRQSWAPAIKSFMKIREKYLLYEP